MIRVHHLNNSRSQRVLWLLEELAVPYEVVRYERDPKTLLAPPELRRIHRLGKSPILEDDGKLYAETGLIVEYLVERYNPALAPPRGSALYWRYRYWLHYAEGSAMSPLLLKLVITRLGWLGIPARGFVARQLALHTAYLESELAESPWFVGPEFTAADVMLSFPIELLRARGGASEHSAPKLTDFLARIHARPAYVRALEQGGPYAYAR